MASRRLATIMARPTYTMTMKWAEMVAPNVRHLSFVRNDDTPLDYIPGQFITFHFEHEGKEVKRSYSIASIPGRNHEVEIAASYFEGGPGSELLFKMQPGDKVTTSGPFGRLVLRDENPQRTVMIATGTGVTPYRSMLPGIEQRLDDNPDSSLIILQGVQTRDQLLYGDDFVGLMQRHPRFEFYACYSREQVTAANGFDAHEKTGYVQQTLEGLRLNPESDVVYLCGNPNMIDEVFTKLKELEFETKQVRREKYIS